MAQLTDATVLTRRPTVIGTDVGDTTVLLDEKDGFLELNPVGAEIWEIIAQPTTVGALVMALMHTFGVDELDGPPRRGSVHQHPGGQEPGTGHLIRLGGSRRRARS